MYTNGIILSRFDPIPTNLVNYALTICNNVLLLVGSAQEYGFSNRISAVKTIYPKLNVHGIEDLTHCLDPYGTEYRIYPEEWCPIRGFEGYYEVSTYGSVRSVSRCVRSKRGSLIHLHGRLRCPTMYQGYYNVQLTKNCIRTRYKVHRLVGEAFHPNPLNKRTVNHINGNKRDNYYLNLEWSTDAENTAHAWNSGLCAHSYGDAHYLSKLTDNQVVEMRNMYNLGVSVQDICAAYNTPKTTVYHLVRGERRAVRVIPPQKYLWGDFILRTSLELLGIYPDVIIQGPNAVQNTWFSAESLNKIKLLKPY